MLVSRPIWIDCGSVADVGSPAELAGQAKSGSHVVLRFGRLDPDEKAALIGRLAAALPDHSVFDSGGTLGRPWITIMPVVSRARVLERRAAVFRALADYRRAGVALVEQHRADTLPPEWRATEHGGHCRFENLRTGQVVEAPVREWADPERVDPYFFAEFVKTTAELAAVAELITDNFHDGAYTGSRGGKCRTSHPGRPPPRLTAPRASASSPA
jgi:hypothetical protein